jgi:hypothetical protein
VRAPPEAAGALGIRSDSTNQRSIRRFLKVAALRWA